MLNRAKWLELFQNKQILSMKLERKSGFELLPRIDCFYVANSTETTFYTLEIFLTNLGVDQLQYRLINCSLYEEEGECKAGMCTCSMSFCCRSLSRRSSSISCRRSFSIFACRFCEPCSSFSSNLQHTCSYHLLKT